MLFRTKFHLTCLLAAAVAAAPLAAAAADYPAKPITIVVGYSAGGGVDAMARILVEKLPSVLGQPVIVENRPSVGAIVASTYVARARPDGYTLLMGPLAR